MANVARQRLDTVMKTIISRVLLNEKSLLQRVRYIIN